jgi:hypothetical protein
MSESGDQKRGLPSVPMTEVTLKIGDLSIPLPPRTFAAIDRLFALPFNALADLLERKLRENLDGHVEAVQEARRQRGKSERVAEFSIKTTRAISEWASLAANVGPEDEELSAVWRALLDEIMDEGDDAEELIRVVRGLRRSDIHFFIRAFAQRNPGALPTPILGLVENDAAIERLRGQGLIKRMFTASALSLFGASLAVMSYFVISLIGSGNKLEIPIVAAFGVFTLVIMYQFWRATALGRQLARLYRLYSRGEKVAAVVDEKGE